MLKKLLALILGLCLLVGCGKSQPSLSVDNGDEPSAPVEQVESVLYKNPLTGEKMSSDKAANRPVAIMVNNINIAQPVQTGLNKADVIYETEVEGGITRLLAVFQDVTAAEKIGTVRSARYVYVDLALGHNAIYVHHGQDPTYCAPHLEDTDHLNLSESNYGHRVKNGLSSEHTLYTDAEKLWAGLKKERNTKRESSATWVDFADEETTVTLGSAATNITVPFSTSYRTVFKYDDQAGLYTRYFKDTLRKDYYTGETTTVKNVFVLLTTIKDYPDGKHRNVVLESGDGYYCVNGTYTPIKWSKGASENSFVFKNVDGTDLTVNAGNSWVCIADKGTSQPTFE